MLRDKHEVITELQHIIDSGINKKRVFDLIVRMSNIVNSGFLLNAQFKRLDFVSALISNSRDFEYQLDLIWFEVNLFDAIGEMDMLSINLCRKNFINLELGKAQKWDRLGEKISGFYSEDGKESEEGEEPCLGTIGEIAASAFGYM